MNLKEFTIGSYFRKEPSDRANIMFDNDENFPRIINCFEKNLKLMILSEKACIRNARRGELGVRIQEGPKACSPTEKQAIESMMIDQAIASGDFSDSYFKDLKVMQDIYDGYTEISVMCAEYESFRAAIEAMPDCERKIILPILDGSKTRGELADEFGLTPEAINQKIKRGRKWIKDNVALYMADYSI